MAKMLPHRCDASTTESAAERALFERFRDEPGTEQWTVLHSLGLARRGRNPYGEIDFVVLIPSAGVFCLEVKGGGVVRHGGVWKTTGRHGTSELKRSPFLQAREGMFALREAVQKRAPAGFPFDRIAMGYAVIFPNVVFSERDPEWEPWQVLDQHALAHPLAASFARLCAEQRRLVHIPAGETEPSRGTVAELVRMLRPDFEVVITRGAEIVETDQRLLQLTEEQFTTLDTLEDNPRALFQGAAGTGKTMLALEAARRAGEAGKKTLLLCFNALLGEWLEARVTEFALGDRVVAGTFHHCLAEVIHGSKQAAAFRAEKARESGSKFFGETLPFFGQLALEESKEKFDRLIIDEAQDLLSPGVLDALDVWLTGGLAAGRWAFFGDFHRQAIFSRETGKELLARLEARCPHFARGSLKVNCRNTRNIGDVTALLAGFPHPPYRAGAEDGPAVDRREYSTAEEQCTVLAEVIRGLLREGVPAREIVVISRWKLENSGVARVDGGGDFRLLPVHAPEPARSRAALIRFATVQAFKGMESRVVIMCDLDALGDAEPQQLLYTGLSRARVQLTVLLHRGVLSAYRECLARGLRQTLKPASQQ